MRSEVLLYPGMAGWHLTYLPKKEAANITKLYGTKRRGWGSLPVSVTLGKTTWQTSIFFEKRSDTYVLPLKAKVRQNEGVRQGNVIKYELKIEV